MHMVEKGTTGHGGEGVSVAGIACSDCSLPLVLVLVLAGSKEIIKRVRGCKSRSTKVGKNEIWVFWGFLDIKIRESTAEYSRPQEAQVGCQRG